MANPWDNDRVVTPAGGATITSMDPYAGEDQAIKRERLRLSQQEAARAAAEADFRQRERLEKQEKEQAEKAQAEQARVIGMRDSLYQLRNTINAAKAAKEKSNDFFATGFGASASAGMGGTSAADVAALLKTIGSNTAFDRLQRMREESPTGGALGAVSEVELALLRDSIASLDQSQSDAQFQANMQKVIDAYERVGKKLQHADQYYTSSGSMEGYTPPTEETLSAMPSVVGSDVAAPPSGGPVPPGAPPSPDGETINYEQVLPGGLEGSVSAEGDPWGESYLSQGLSGFNEGLASLLGFPVDATTMGLNLVPQGINAIANTQIPTIENPFLGSEWLREQMGDVGAIGYESQDPTNQFVRRASQSLGASAVPVGATAGTLRQGLTGLAMGLGGGIGGATAQQVAPGNIGAEIAGELIGSAIPGVGAFNVARRGAQRAAEASVPTTAQLREQAGNLYTQAERRGVVASPDVTRDIAGRATQIARQEELITPTGRIDAEYPKSSAALNRLNDYAGTDMNPKQIQRVRDTLTDAVAGGKGNDRRIARILLQEFDDATVPLAPELGEARNVASRYLQADRINRARDLAEARAAQFTGSGMENALRTEFRGLDRDIVKGRERFPEPVAAAIQEVSRGTPVSNAARMVGKAAPTGVVSTGVGTAVPFMVGTAIGGPGLGSAASLGTMGVGQIARNLATRQTERAAEVAELLARSGGRIPDYAPILDEATALRVGAPTNAQLANLIGGYSNYE